MIDDTDPTWRRQPGFGPRYLLPAALAVIQVVGTHFAARGQPERAGLGSLAIVLLLAGPAALVFRQRHPVAVLALVLVATLSYVLLGYPRGPIFLSLIVAFVTAVISGHRLAAVVLLVVGYSSFLWLPYLTGTEPRPSLDAVLGLAAWLLVLLTGAEIARTRRERALEAMRTRTEEARRRASEERLRIARELHDVLAHNISLINVQAGVALHLIDERPEQARTALAAIKKASNEALGELRAVLDILRRGHEDELPRGPMSGLARVDDLVQNTEAAGLRVTKQVTGSPRSLPASVDLAAFRIVQEALTNVTRHAPGADTTIEINYGEDELAVEVENDGSPSPQRVGGAGRGIRGMRERVEALGGELEAGPRSEGGFRVRATLPLDGDRTGEAS